MNELLFTSRAEKQLSKLPITTIKKILYKLEQAAEFPEKADLKKLRGFEDLWRIRIGDFRVIFKYENETMIVTKVGHRKDIYKQ
jgi:mRNA interferase RelE/StbE